MKEYVPGQRVVYGRNPHFWRRGVDGRTLPYLDEFVFLVVRDWNTMALKFRSEEADVLDLRPTDYPSLKRGEAGGNYTIFNRGLNWGFEYLSLNMNPAAKVDRNLIALFQDVRFRRAVSHAVNRQRIVDDILLGFGVPLYGPETPANRPFYNPNIPKYPYDPARAKALLAEIGLRDDDGNGFLEFRGREVRFNILTNVENDQRAGIATIASDDLRRIGINAQFTPISFNDLIGRLDNPPHEWEAVVLGFTGGQDPNDGKGIWRSSGDMHQWRPKQKQPATPWEAELDRIFTDGALELDPAKRRAIYDRYQVIVAGEEPFIFTVDGNQLTAVRNRFRNVKPCSSTGVTWNAEEIFDGEAGGRMA
jgi:peptide/nickel transport system substrate-binding protein